MPRSILQQAGAVRSLWVLLAIFVCLDPHGASAEKRVALVIGNSAYQNVPRLENPKRDAAAIASALRRVGFDTVTERNDLTSARMIEELRSFGDAALDADWAMVFYAGHGLQADGQNYLVPVDAKLRRAMDVEEEAVPLERVLSKVRGAHKLRLVVLDACRDNPFSARMEQAGRKRSLGRGLARLEPEAGEMVAYSARDGQQAEDGDGQHSPYTTALLKEIEHSGIEVNMLFRQVHDAVLSQTNQKQEPYVYGALPAEAFYFKQPALEALRPPVHDAAPVGDGRRDEARELWSSLKDATSEAQLRQFMTDYADTPYARYAQIRLGELKELTASSQAGECGRLAASPTDEQREGEGVEFDHIDAALAVPACRKAVAARPDDGRLMRQFGRALYAKGDFSEAREWFEKAIDKGDTLAMNSLGYLYDNGQGVSQDYAVARKWYEKAAEKGEAMAMANLGILYHDGRGVKQDYVMARKWYEKAVEKGGIQAMTNLGVLYYNGRGVKQDHVMARKWFEKAAEKGDVQAMTSLGVLYHNGQGVAKNKAKAREWYTKAAAAGSKEARRLLKQN